MSEESSTPPLHPAVAHNLRGFELRGQGRVEEALAEFKKAIELAPDYADAHTNLGHALLALGRIDEAKIHFERALAAMPGHPPAQKGLPAIVFAEAEQHNLAGMDAKKSGDLDKALIEFAMALELVPEYADAHTNLGYTLQSLGRVAEAMRSFERALALEPGYFPAQQGAEVARKRLAKLGAATERYTASNLTWGREESHQLGLPERTTPRSRIGFAFQLPEMINHYNNIWNMLDPNEFELIDGCERQEDNTAVADYAARAGYATISISEVIRRGYIYDIIVSHHPFVAGNTATGLPLLGPLARHHVRMMYSLGKAEWNFADWNRFYDVILCFGPYQAAQLSRVCGAAVAQVGYPRLDVCFKDAPDRSGLLQELRCDPDKPTVVWLPTWSRLSSIDDFADAIATLKGDYNLLIKLHPDVLANDPRRLQILEANGLDYVREKVFDNAYFFYLADFILADYGGSPFGAIYADRNLLLLNVSGASNDETTGRDSPDVRLREWFPNLDVPHRMQLASLLKNSALWAGQRALRAEVCRQMFAPFKGFSADVAALTLRQLSHVLHSSLVGSDLQSGLNIRFDQSEAR